MTNEKKMEAPYVCPQCGPDPRGSEEHARLFHTFMHVDEPRYRAPAPTAPGESDYRDAINVISARLGCVHSTDSATAAVNHLANENERLCALVVEYDKAREAEATDAQGLLLANVALREQLAGVRALTRDEHAALSYVIDDLDGWIDSLTKSLADPEFGSALSDYERFIKESKEELEERKRHVATLRRLAALPASADEGEKT